MLKGKETIAFKKDSNPVQGLLQIIIDLHLCQDTGWTCWLIKHRSEEHNTPPIPQHKFTISTRTHKPLSGAVTGAGRSEERSVLLRSSAGFSHFHISSKLPEVLYPSSMLMFSYIPSICYSPFLSVHILNTDLGS